MVELPDIQEIREDGGPVDDNTEENIKQQIERNAEKSGQDLSAEEIDRRAGQVIAELENIHAEAKQNGKEEERMKGDDSDTMFLMVALALASSVINSGVLIWINFLA